MNDTTALEFIKISGPLDYPFEERSHILNSNRKHTHSFTICRSIWSHFIVHRCICCTLFEIKLKRPSHTAHSTPHIDFYFISFHFMCLFVYSCVAEKRTVFFYFAQIFKLSNGNAQWHCNKRMIERQRERVRERGERVRLSSL